MVNVKYQVFVSSTYTDLKDERDQVIKGILEMGHVPVGMEMFSAADEQQWRMITRQIDQSDYYVVLVAHRYGSVTDAGVGYTEKEYDYAVATGVPVLGFVIDETAAWPPDRMETEAGPRAALAAFREKAKRRPVGFWRTSDDLYAKVPIALMKAFNTAPRPGWVRVTENAGPEVLGELARLSAENSQLRAELAVAKARELVEDQSALDRTVEMMRLNVVPISIYEAGGSGWVDQLPMTLLRVFGLIAPELLTETSTDHIAYTIALGSVTQPGTRLRQSWPFPANQVDSILADLQAILLVQPSSKKHQVADTKKYWTLTILGGQLLGAMRKQRLEAAGR